MFTVFKYMDGWLGGLWIDGLVDACLTNKENKKRRE